MPLAHQEKTHRFYMLDLFRFIAAISVVMGHTPFGRDLPGFRATYLAVDFFFVLSGFVLAWRYYDIPDNKKFDYKKYAVARIARLWPLNIFGLLLAAAVMPPTPPAIIPPNMDMSWGLFLMNFFLLQGTGLGAEGTFDFPSWSVSSELWINLLFPLLFLRGWWKAALIAAAIYIYLLITYRQLDLWGPPKHGMPGIDMLRCFAGFTCGVVTYYFYKFTLQIDRHRWALVFYSATEIAVIIAAAVFCNYCLWKIPASFFAIPLFMSMVFIFGHQKGIISLAIKPVRRAAILLGAISYGAYLLHVPISIITGLNGLTENGLRGLITVTTLASLATYCAIEVPAKKLLVKWGAVWLH